MPHRLISSLPITQRFFAPPFGFALNDTLFSSPGLSPVYPLRHRPLTVLLRPPKAFLPHHTALSFHPFIRSGIGPRPCPCACQTSSTALAFAVIPSAARNLLLTAWLAYAAPLDPISPASAEILRSSLRMTRCFSPRRFAAQPVARPPGCRLRYSSSQSGRITGEKAKSRPW